MYCEKCFHYNACAGMDVEGHMYDVMGPGDCDNFLSKKFVKLIYPINCFYGKMGDKPGATFKVTSKLCQELLNADKTQFEKFIDSLIEARKND